MTAVTTKTKARRPRKKTKKKRSSSGRIARREATAETSASTTRRAAVAAVPVVSEPDNNDAAPAEASWLLGDSTSAEVLYRGTRSRQAEWARRSVSDRLAILDRLRAVLADRMEPIAALVREENGKPEVEAISHEVGACIAFVEHLCRVGERHLAGRTEIDAWLPFRVATVTPRPLGVVLIIAPWNVPLAIPFTQTVAALAAGNAVVLKPSEVTPRIGAAIGELLTLAGVPDGLVEIVQGDGKVGAELIDARPDKVFFTGSVATGRRVMAAAARHPIPVCLELGGIDAMIVRDDADLDFAAAAATWGGLFNGGQVCASVERLLVHESVADRVISRLVDRIGELDEDADLGRITSARQRQIYDRHIADARERGLTIACGGRYIGRDKLAPTVIRGPGLRESLVWREETFGPVIAVSTFRDDDHAISLHNDTRFGLTASIISGDVDAADRIAARLDVGAVAINDVAATLYARPALPWGGRGESGFGSSHGREGLLAFTRPHVVDRAAAGLNFKRPWWFPYDSYQREAMRQFALTVARSAPRERVIHAGKLLANLAGQLINTKRL